MIKFSVILQIDTWIDLFYPFWGKFIRKLSKSPRKIYSGNGSPGAFPAVPETQIVHNFSDAIF